MDLREMTLNAVQHAMDAFEQSNVSVASLIRHCQRVANLRNDALGSALLHMETVDITMPEAGRVDFKFPQRVEALSASMPREEAYEALLRASEARLARMTLPAKKSKEQGTVWGASVASLEKSVAMIRGQIESLDRDSSIVGATNPRKLLENEQIRLSLTADLHDRQTLLERTKAFLFDFLLNAQEELLRGQTYAASFEATIRYVEEELRDISPDAASELLAAQPRLLEGTPAALSQAMVSCRRALKSIADALFPPQRDPIIGADGRAREAGEAHYLNRLIHFAAERTESRTMTEMLQAGLDALGRRLNALDDLDNKGVHARVTVEEANASLAQTYLLMAEVLRLRGGENV